MERLTLTREQRKAEGVGYARYFNEEICQAVDERLSAYEDTGLTPEQCAELAGEMVTAEIGIEEDDDK